MNEQSKPTLPLIRTVDKVKNTTITLRGFADSVDHLLNAIEEFYPFIEKMAETSDHLHYRHKIRHYQRRRF